MLRSIIRLITGRGKQESAAPTTVTPVVSVSGMISYSTDGHHGFVAVVGESHYQETLLQLKTALDTLERDPPAFEAFLIPEPENPHDPNAVAVATPAREKIGYLSRDVARSYHKALLKQGTLVSCPAELVGGTREKPAIGVVLDFAEVRRLKES